MALRHSSLLTCVAALALCTYGFPAHAEPMEKAVIDALNYHPSVEAAIAGRDVSRDVAWEKKSAYYPEVSVNAATGRIYGDNSTSRGLTVDRGAGYSWNHEGGVSVRQMIFDGMETPNRVDAAEARRQSANVNVADVRENLALRVVLAYLEVMRNRDSYNMIKDHARKISDYRSRIGKMVEQGAADESMSVQAHDIQNQLDSTLADIEGQLNKALAEYMEAVGHPAEEPLVRPELKADIIPAKVEDAITLAHKSHPAVIAASLEDQAAGYEISAEKGTLYPDVTGDVSYFKKDVDDIIGGEAVDARALVRLNWTFSTGGAQLAKISQSVHRHAEAQAKEREIAVNLEREVRKAYAEMDAAKKRLDAGRDRVTVSKDLVDTYEKQFEAAKVSILNLLQAENTHFNARLGALNADYRHLAAQYTLLANTGHLQDALNVKPVSHD